MASRHVAKAISRAASVVVESLERRQLLSYSTLELAPAPVDSSDATVTPLTVVGTPDVIARASSGPSVRLSWPAVDGARHGYEIQRRTADNAYEFVARVDGTAALGRIGGRVSYIDLGLEADQGYTYRVRAVGLRSVRGEWSKQVSVLTAKKAQQLKPGRTLAMANAAAELGVVPTSGTSAKLSWSDLPEGASGYEIQRRQGDDAFVTIATRSGADAVADINTQLSYEDTGLAEGTGYTYRVRALGVQGDEAAWSNESSTVIPVVSRTNQTMVSPAGVSQVSTIAAIADAHVRGGTSYQGQNYGDDWGNVVKKSATTDQIREAFYKFDLSTIDGPVSNVKVRFYAKMNSSDGTRQFDLKAVSSTSWGELTLTYTNKPTIGSTVNSFSLSSTTYQWYEIDVTSHIQSQIAAGNSTVSFALVGNANSNAYLDIASRDWDNSTPPQLQVTSDVPYVTRTATEDAFVRNGSSAGNNYGSDVLNLAKLNSANEERESLHKFDLSGWQDKITNVKLRLYGRLHAADGTKTFNVYSNATTSWSEGSVTWSTKPGKSSSAISSFNVTNTTDQWYEIDVTSFVQTELAAGRTTLSFNVAGAASSTAYFRSTSKESLLNPAELRISTDLAQGKTTTSSSGSSPSNATDGNAGTKWTASNANGEYLQVDLGETIALTSARIRWDADYASAYKIQVSPTGTSSWTDAYSTTSGTAAVQNITFTGTGRYVRLLGVTRGTANAIAVKDFNLYGHVPTGPAAPSGLSAASVAATAASLATVSLSWTDNASDETGFILQRKPTSSGSWSTIATPAANATSYSDTTAATDTNYDYQIAATNGGGDSSYVSVTNVATPPTAASGLAITGTTLTSNSLSWTDNSSKETEYRVERRNTGGSSYSTIASGLAANTASYTDTTAVAGTQYDYRVRAVRGGLDGWASTPVQSPAPATGVSATVAASTAVTVTWTDNASDETGYEVVYSTSSTFSSGVSTLTASANATSKLVTGLTAGTTYYFLVRTKTATSQSLSASAVSATTLGALGVGRSPSGTQNEGTQITLSATYASGTAVSGTTYAWTVLRNGGAFTTGSGATFQFDPVNEGTYTASVVATTPSGVTDSASLSPSLTVVNVAPTLTASGDSTVTEDTEYTLELLATDPSTTDTITWNIDWGDGSTVEHPTGRDIDVPHEYATPGAYTITITGGDGTATNVASSPATISVTVTDAAPAAPTGLHTTSVTPTGPTAVTVALAWTDNSGNETGFKVERREAGGSWAQIATPAANATSYSDTTAVADKFYEYRVRATNGAGDSDYSTLTDVLTPPAAPAALTVTGTTATSVSLLWTDNATTEAEYRVERRLTGGTTYTTIASGLAANSASYTDTTASEGTQYDYRVRAVRGTSQDGAAAGPVQAWTRLATPTGVSAAVAAASAITITWTDNTSSETHYEIDVSSNGSFPGGGTDTRTAASVSGTGGTGSFLVDDLSPGTTYYFRVRAENDNTDSANSSSASTATLGALGVSRSPSSGDPDEGTLVTLTAAYASGTAISGTTYEWTMQRDSDDPFVLSGSSVELEDPDDGTYTVSVVAMTPSGAEDTGYLSPSLVLASVAPTLTASGDESVAAGDDYVLTLTATDPRDADVITWSIDWDDGSEVESAEGRELELEHQYAQAGSYEIRITAEDGTETGVTPTPATIEVTVTSEAPTILEVELIDESTATVHWSDNRADETGWEVRFVDTATSDVLSTTVDGHAGSGEIEATYDELEPGTVYEVSIRSLGGTNSDWSDPVTVTMPIAPTGGTMAIAEFSDMRWRSWVGLFHNDNLSSGAAGEWSTYPVESNENVEFGNESLTYRLSQLPRHTYLSIAVDIEGYSDGSEPDITFAIDGETLPASGGASLVDEYSTFYSGRWYVEGTVVGNEGMYYEGVYNWQLTAHEGTTATIEIAGSGFAGSGSWHVRNLAVSAYLPTTTISASPTSVSENGTEAQRVITYTVSRSSTWLADELPIDLDWNSGDAQLDDIVGTLPAQVIIPATQVSTTFDVVVKDDAFFEDSQTLVATIQAGRDKPYVALWDNTASVTIYDNDAPDFDADSDDNDKHGVPQHSEEEDEIEAGSGKRIATSAGQATSKKRFVPLRLDPASQVSSTRQIKFNFTDGIRLWSVPSGEDLNESESWLQDGNGGHAIKEDYYYPLSQFADNTVWVEGTRGGTETISVEGGGGSDTLVFDVLTPNCPTCGSDVIKRNGDISTRERDVEGKLLSPTREGNGTGSGYDFADEAELVLCGNAVAILEGDIVRIYDWDGLEPRIPGQGTLEDAGDGFVEHLPDGRTLHFDLPPSEGSGSGARSVGRLTGRVSPGGSQHGRVFLEDRKLDYEWATLGEYTERARYSYDSVGRVNRITLTGQWGTADEQVIRYAEYEYYDSESFGNNGDLKKVSVYDKNDDLVDTKYYRYYTAAGTGAIPGKIKLAFGKDAYARMLAAGYTEATSDEIVKAYADDYFVYDTTTGQVHSVASSGAGCSSCSGGVGMTTYSYATSSFDSGYNNWRQKRTEELEDGTTTTLYTNFADLPLLEVVTSGSQIWRTYYRYDENGKQVLKANPSAVTGFSESNADLIGASDASETFTDLYFVDGSSGVVEIREYYGPGDTDAGEAPGELKATWLRQGDGTGNYTAGRVKQSFYTYTGTLAGGVTTYFVDTSTVYRDASENPTDALVTDYDYVFYAGTAQMQTRILKRPIVLSTQNGPGTQVTETEYYDLEGRLLWSKDGEGYITGYVYNDDGSLEESIVDVDTSLVSDEPSGWTKTGGKHLETLYTTDDLGRTIKTVDPKGNITFTVYKDAEHEVRTYRADSSGTIVGPVSVSREDRALSYTESLTYAFDGTYTVDGNGIPTGEESLDDEDTTIHSLSRATYNAGGQMVESIAFHNLTGVTYSQATARLGTEGTNYTVTYYSYDKQGRQNRVENANGTITHTVYDGVGQVLSTWVGTDDEPTTGYWSPTNNTGANMVKVSESEYDNGTAGDGNVTRSISYVTNSTDGARITDYAYDWRNRLVATKSGVESDETGTDNVQRQIVYSDLNNLGQQLATYVYDADDVTLSTTKPSSDLLRAKTINEYDNHGRVFRTETYSVDPETGVASANGIISQSWFDKRGQVIKTASTASPTQKTVYDGAGRVTKSYVTDGGGDTGYADADDVIGDTVLEQAEYTYDANSNVILTTSRQRFHDATGTGELGMPSSGIGARVSYAASYYDALDRVTDSVNVGTNGGSAWTRPGTVPGRSDNVLVTSYSYDDAGRLHDVTDPKEIVTRTEYDALGRTTRTVEAFTNGVPTDSTNRITAYTYDGLGNVTHLKAVLPDGPDSGTDYDVQDTQYVYGATTARGDGINSNDVLIAVRYPDKSTGLASVGEQEDFATNALGQTTSKTDRNGNAHTFTYDVLGRLTSDAVTTLGAGVDGAVRRIDTTYDTQGLPETITSYDADEDGDVVNQVRRKYNGLGQLTHEYQAHDGAVDTDTTPSVQYGYSSLDDGSRLTQLTYPNGRELTYSYGSSNSLSDNISRLDAIVDGVTTLESYAYLGLSGVVKRMHPQSGIDLTYIGTPADAGDQYAGLDRFGRVVDQKWDDSGTPVDRFTYTYDRNSNRLTKANPLFTAHSEAYTYDSLNRLATTNRNGSAYQSWDLDALGNSDSVTTSGVAETRTHNSQNQLTQMGSNALAFDDNGNTTTDQHARTLVYDAWNRLVEAKNGSTSLIRYEYDGLTRRIEEDAATDPAIHQYFSAAWQVLEEQVAGDTTASYAWSPVYVDAMIARDRNTTGDDSVLEERLYVLNDANFNVTAIADTSGNIVERYLYDPYGKRTVLDANYTNDADNTSNSAFQHGHQGGKYDSVLSNQMLFRYRVFDTDTMAWTQMDPLRYPDGPNSYLYVNGTPTVLMDPSGLKIFINVGDGREFREKTRDAFQAIVGTCATIKLDPSGLITYEEPAVKPESCKTCNSCWEELKAAIDDPENWIKITKSDKIDATTIKKKGETASVVEVRGKAKRLPEVRESGEVVYLESPFPVILWHEVIAHGVMKLEHQKIRENTREGNSGSGYTDPVIAVENKARKCMSDNGAWPGLLMRAAWYYEKSDYTE